MSQRAFEARQTRDTLTARDVEAELDLGQLCDVQTPADLVAAGEVEGGDGRGRRGGTALSLGLAARGADVGASREAAAHASALVGCAVECEFKPRMAPTRAENLYA